MAAPRSGLSAQVMISPEVTVGTYVAPASGLYLLPGETLNRSMSIVESDAIIATRQLRDTSQHYPGNEMLSGTLPLELSDVGCEDVLRILLGAPVKTGSGPTYTRTWAGLLDLYGISATVQIGRPDDAGTVNPFTWLGTKATAGTFGLTEDKPVTLNLAVAAMNEVNVRTVTDGVTTNTDATVTSATAAFTPDDVGKPISGTGIPANTTISSYTSATSVELSANATADGTGITFTIGVALASASYTSGMKPFTFIGGTTSNTSVTVGGATPPAIKKAELKIERPQATDRRGVGSGRILQPIVNDLASVTLEFECEFDGLTHYRRYIANSEHAAVLTLVSPANNTLTFTMNGYYKMPPEPQVKDRGILTQKISLNMANTTDAGAFTAVLVNTVS